MSKHRVISLLDRDQALLYLSKILGGCFPNRLWPKRKQLHKLYERSEEEIDKSLNFVKIINSLKESKILLNNCLIDEDVKYKIRHSKEFVVNLEDTPDEEP